MKSCIVWLFIFFVSSSCLKAQGIVRGKVTDESGEALIGVAITLKSNPAYGVTTDLDGNFSLKVPEGVSQVIVVSYVSFKTMEHPIPALKKNEVLVKNFSMVSQSTLKEVEIVAKQVKANEYYMETFKKKSAATMDYISAQTMTKTGDQNVVAAVARVSGVSTSGGLITVRGIGDRYVKTTLNGSRIPTLDPLTNNIKLDLFPASLVDNIIITKTSSPDLPGDWSGAYISVETKDYPDKLSVNVESQFGYNPQTTFKNFLSSDRSATDWLGFDNGMRNRTHGNLENPNLAPTPYDEMVALGLGNYYSSIGITKSWDLNSPEAQTYFKLGLVQLGLLPPAQINDETAYNHALETYNTSYKKHAFNSLNPEGSNYNNGFSNNWNVVKRRAPLNFSQNFSVGNQTSLFEKPLGYLFGFRYGTFIRYDPDGISQRVGAEEVDYRFEVQDKALISRETSGWNALFNLAYKLNDKNTVAFLFMPNFIGTNDVSSYSTIPDGSRNQEARTNNNIFYEQRRQLVYQVKSEHLVAGPKLKIDFNASYTKGNSIAPDFKVLEYGYQRDNQTGTTDGYLFGPSVGEGIRRYYRYLADNILDSRISGELPIGKQPASGVRKLKFGGAYLLNERSQRLYDYRVFAGNSVSLPVLGPDEDLNAVMGPEHFTMQNQIVDFVYHLEIPDRNFTIGKSSVTAAFVMLDYSVVSFLRFAGGLRVESAMLFTDVESFHNKGYKPNDIRRVNQAGFPYVNPANINEVNYLPSANFIFKLQEKETRQVNLRLNYSQTIARPSLRELNDAAIYDYEYRTMIYGNSELLPAHVKNYDLRLESYFEKGDNFSFSFFYKDFRNHIEMSFGNSGITWNNVGKSYVGGIEVEGKKSLGRHFEVRSNITLTKSNSQVIRKNFEVVEGIKVFTPVDTINRSMFGQAPYLINAILGYNLDSLGLSITASYNVQGPRLVIAGVLKGRPDVYEMPRHTVDIKISKRLAKRFAVSFSIRDLLNAPVRRSYILPSGHTDYDKFRYGTNYLFSVSYKI